MYHLQGIVLHRGVIEGGHYWAYVKDGLNWYSVDDENVEKLNQD
jgi:ubiquitin C-terminal hydrolase